MELYAGRLVKVYILRGRRRAKLQSIRTREWFILVLSNLVIAATGGLSLLWQLSRVYTVARTAPAMTPRARWLLVLGVRLQKGAITDDYALRLEKAQALQTRGPKCRILLLGGSIGAEGVTEAEKGKEYLAGRGVSSSRIMLEDRSRNTLENLRCAQAVLGDTGTERAVLITNRYHLARCQAIAVGLGLPHTLCAAEERLRLDAHVLVRFLPEAYYLHWIVIGRVWDRLAGRANS